MRKVLSVRIEDTVHDDLRMLAHMENQTIGGMVTELVSRRIADLKRVSDKLALIEARKAERVLESEQEETAVDVQSKPGGKKDRKNKRGRR